MRRVLVTGGSGFVGRHALPLLVAAGFDTHATTRGHPFDVPGVTWHEGDLLVGGAATTVVRDVRPTHLLHLAWEATPGVFWESPDNDRWLEASVELVDAFAATSGERAVGAGTCAEYDWTTDGVYDETTSAIAPATRYGRAKDALRGHLAATAGSWAWGRVFLVYGPGEHPARFVPSIVNALLEGRAAEMTSGAQVRDLVDVRDLAAAFVALVAGTLTGPVNLGSGEPVTLADVALELAGIAGAPTELVHLGARPDRAGEPAVLLPCLDRLHGELGWTVPVTRVARLREIVHWWREQGAGR